MRVSIEEIAEDFPDTRIGFVAAGRLRISPQRLPPLDAAIRAAEANTRAAHAGKELAAIPEIQDWRRAYKGFGIKKTSYRSSVERLVKNVLAGRDLARINNLVDAYNLISLQFIVPIGGDDLDKVVGPVCFRRARADDTFFALGSDGETDDPPKAGEVVYADAEKILCRRWNWYQDARSPVSTATRRAILTVQAQANADIETATHALCDALQVHCGAETRSVILSASLPEADLPIATD